jgi:hypothetical protein
MGKIVKKHLYHFIVGVSQVLVLDTGREYESPAHGFKKDLRKLRGDSAKVGKGLRKKLKQVSYEQPANHR